MQSPLTITGLFLDNEPVIVCSVTGDSNLPDIKKIVTLYDKSQFLPLSDIYGKNLTFREYIKTYPYQLRAGIE